MGADTAPFATAVVPSVQDMGRGGPVNNFREVQVTSSPLAWALCALTAPLSFLQGWWILSPREEAISLHFGSLTGHYKQAGCTWTNPCGVDLRRISTAQVSTLLGTQKVIDKTGNPIVVNAVLTYRIADAGKALLNVDSPTWYVETQAQAVVKDVVSRFSYDELKTETAAINEQMLRRLGPLVEVAGARIQTVNLNELNYAQEIAVAMLKRQQARAVVEARHLLVQGAVEISSDAVERLSRNGIEMDDRQRARLVSNLVLVTSGDVHASPVLTL